MGELVDQIQPHLIAALDEPLIVVLQLMKAQKFRGKSAKELKEGLISDDECSYPSELDEICKVIKFVDDEALFKEYNHPSLTYIEPLFEGGQNYGGNERFEAPIKNSLSECGSSLTDISVDTTEKQTFKRSKYVGFPIQEYDDDCNDKQSTNNVRKVIKKEKNMMWEVHGQLYLLFCKF
ncbi:hypothetical protein CQW23_07544 [Capsicum baccatum]|uniref:Uncharacterized protein n=1 Tax=Capsicum baccatum TaxID=33114 RepID=A0A2G2X6E9_CAPBA|nr:hypothetical protein CQW23_07544 [Capsicum baccatum]